MSPREAVDLARYVRAHFPQQPVDEFTADALAETCGAYPAADCRLAVLNLAERGDEWCPPTAVKAEVKRIRAKRIADYGVIEPPADMDPDNVVGYQRWLSAMRKGIADGTIAPPPSIAITGSRDVIRELGQAGQDVDTSAAMRDLRSEREAARRKQQEKAAEQKRLEDEKRAQREAARAADREARDRMTDRAVQGDE
jgi:hypothetical protein